MHALHNYYRVPILYILDTNQPSVACLNSLRSAGVGIVGVRSAGVGIAGVWRRSKESAEGRLLCLLLIHALAIYPDVASAVLCCTVIIPNQ